MSSQHSAPLRDPFLSVRQCPPLVTYRRRLTDDPMGPYGPAAEWLPKGWESETYPTFDNVESIQQWLGYEQRSVADIGSLPSRRLGMDGGWYGPGKHQGQKDDQIQPFVHVSISFLLTPDPDRPAMQPDRTHPAYRAPPRTTRGISHHIRSARGYLACGQQFANSFAVGFWR